MYVLDEYLASKSNKQVAMLVRNKVGKYNSHNEIVDRVIMDGAANVAIEEAYDEALRIQDDCYQWLQAAVYCISPELWNSWIIEDGDMELFSYEALTC